MYLFNTYINNPIRAVFLGIKFNNSIYKEAGRGFKYIINNKKRLSSRPLINNNNVLL